MPREHRHQRHARLRPVHLRRAERWSVHHPGTNPLTGNPVAGGAPTDTPALIQGPFETAYLQFPNFNLGARAKPWGEIGVRANVHYAKVLDLFSDGVNLSGRSVGSGLPKYQTRLDLSHRAGKFSHTLQWIWVDRLVGDVFTDPSTYAEQSPTFVQPAYSYFNH